MEHKRAALAWLHWQRYSCQGGDAARLCARRIDHAVHFQRVPIVEVDPLNPSAIDLHGDRTPGQKGDAQRRALAPKSG